MKAWVHVDFFGGKSATGWLLIRCDECEEYECDCADADTESDEE